MALDESRDFLFLAIEMADLAAATDCAKVWFEDLKEWEKQETFTRAYLDGRMTGRSFNPGAKLGQINVPVVNQKINLDTGFTGMTGRLNPENFAAKKKNELGLHDLSAVLLRPSLPISKQLFSNTGIKALMFVPLPDPADLRVFALLAQMAKANPSSPLHAVYLTIRASFTRIKLGADYDMHSGFSLHQKLSKDSGKPDGKTHVRYGRANIIGGQFAIKILGEREANAIDYKNKIGNSKSSSEANNEVVLTMRQHMGPFPVIGMPDKANTYKLYRMYGDMSIPPTPCGVLGDNGEVSG